jgi:hypothetical protein
MDRDEPEMRDRRLDDWDAPDGPATTGPGLKRSFSARCAEKKLPIHRSAPPSFDIARILQL